MVTFASGPAVTIGGSSLPGGNSVSTWGIPVADAGVPLTQYATYGPVDPLTIWRTQPSVRKVVGFIARNSASVPWHAYVRESDTDRRRDASSPAERKLARPKRFQSGFRLWRDTFIDSCLYDLWCVAYIGNDLQRVSPRLLDIKKDFFGNIVEIGIKVPDGTVLPITDLPLAIGTGWSPTDGVGVSPLLTLQEILGEQRNAVAWRNAQWRNAPKLSGVLKRPKEAGDWDDRKRDRFVESWRAWRDTDAGGTPVLEDGMEYETFDDVKPADAKDIEGRQLTDAEVASAFHIAPELVGARQGTFSNIAAFRQMLFGPALGPHLEEFQQAVNIGLVPALDTRDNVYVELDREAAMNGSFAEQAQILSTSIGGPWLTRNEGRAKQNLPAVEGGDELITPLNVIEGGLASPRDTGEQNADLTSEKSVHLFEVRDPVAVKRQARLQLELRKAAGDDERARLVSAIARVYKQQVSQIDAGSTIDADAFHEQWDAIMADAIHSHLFGASVDQAQTVLAHLNAPSGVWSADAMRAYVQKMADTAARGLNTGVVDAASAQDWSEEDAKGSLLGTLAGAVAIAWAASILTDARGFGGHDAASAAGAKTKSWEVRSTNPRPSHAELSGETVPADGTFSNGLRWPGDKAGSVDEVAGCTCGVTYHF
ncbi:phage portal protein [Leifsonia sp. WHRI 6310E]|uniref:phage portal protein n=1 Tax=Leifsonia sp. WHRI 6310E TaxID=3162562 RepID=UPI0032ED4363